MQMLTDKSLTKFLDELASNSPAPGGGSVAALAGALGSALTSMVANLTIGKKKYIEVETEMTALRAKSEELRKAFTLIIDQDTDAFNKVMEAFGLPKENDDQKALRSAAIQEATKEAALIPLRAMKLVVDALALAKVVAEKGNSNSASDAGVAALMLHAGAEGAALNVYINLSSINDQDFVGWHTDEVATLQRTCKMKSDEIIGIVNGKVIKKQ
jgi:methenyltetrahydrofolate cyclohydrolase